MARAACLQVFQMLNRRIQQLPIHARMVMNRLAAAQKNLNVL
jgi:hypothetical protein